ncbi:hypothetical protein [Sphingomonas sp.]|uniref:hypothetical protein n=1 Tax=Sphingomonas sp. TaxID=28214 RepID=UPI0028A92A25|nr:hypothetical protein [Sphingomonas sp.]
MTSIANTSPIERIARVIAAEMLSPNAEGAGELGRPVSEIVDTIWARETDRALAVMRTLREPTATMIEAGRVAGDDPARIWSAMVNAAIAEAVAQAD